MPPSPGWPAAASVSAPRWGGKPGGAGARRQHSPAHTRARTPRRVYTLTCTQHTDTTCRSKHNARIFTITPSQDVHSHTNKNTHTHKYTVVNSVTLLHTQYFHRKLCNHIKTNTTTMSTSHKNTNLLACNYTLTRATTYVHTLIHSPKHTHLPHKPTIYLYTHSPKLTHKMDIYTSIHSTYTHS